MSKPLRKTLLVVAKLTLACVLLAWVLGRSHWSNYVVERGTGKTFAVVSGRGGADQAGLTVSRGMLWWYREQSRPASDFVDDGKGIVRPGFAQSLRGLEPTCLALAMAGYLVSMLCTAVRWWTLLKVVEIRIGLWEAVRLTFLGQLFHTIIPGTVGGDLVKAYYVARHTPRKAGVLVSVFVDRVLGLTELTLLAGLMLLVVLVTGLAGLDDPGIRPAAITCGVVVALVAGALTFLLSGRFRRIFHLQKLYRRLPVAHHIEAAGEAAAAYRRRPGTLLGAVGITFLAHLSWIGSLALLGRSLDLPVEMYKYFLYIPLIYIIGAVPITPGGVGLIEDLYLRFFAPVSSSAVLALALLGRLLPTFWGLPGLWVMLTGARPPKAETIQAELTLDEDLEPVAGPHPPAAP